MRSTLFYIPHSLGPLPIFGWGWAFLALLAVWLLTRFMAVRERRADRSLSSSLFGSLMGWLVAAAAIVWLIPMLETDVELGDGQKITVGLPIRGYGVMLLLAVLVATLWTHRRGRRFGLDLDRLLSLATWGMIGGIGGARLFYVVQKWSEFQSDDLGGRLLEALRYTEGGLVVYGGVIGGLAATLLWCLLRKWSFLLLADLVTPPFLVGLAIGRVGCLLNGCCYGGVCDVPLPSLQFPNGSPPYFDQLQSGQLLGVKFAPPSTASPAGQLIEAVSADSWAEANEIAAGSRLIISSQTDLQNPAKPPKLTAVVIGPQGDRRSVALPSRSLAVHPAQVYATINAAILSGLLGTLAVDPRRRGRVFGWGLLLYGVSRFFEEFVRVDELGQFGTSLSIGQWVSFVVIAAGVAMLIATQLASMGKAAIRR